MTLSGGLSDGIQINITDMVCDGDTYLRGELHVRQVRGPQMVLDGWYREMVSTKKSYCYPLSLSVFG